MINKVKPFYIKITDDMTPQMVQCAFDKCVDAGAIANDGCKSAISKSKYRSNFDINNYGVFGVRFDYGTYIEVSSSYFGKDAQEITLDQLDEWLGLEGEREWKNGDSCIFGSDDRDGVYIAYDKYNSGHVIYSCGDYFYVLDGDFQKPETPEQKAERERQHAVYDMCSDLDNHTDDARFWCEKLYDSGYRKQ